MVEPPEVIKAEEVLIPKVVETHDKLNTIEVINPKEEVKSQEEDKPIIDINERLEEYFKNPFILYNFENSSKYRFDKFFKIVNFFCKTNYIFYEPSQKPINHLKLIGNLDVPIIVIGNSPDVKKYELGDIIENFPIVIRINDWKTKGFEKHIGSKTDIWFSCASVNTQVYRRKEDTYNKLITILGSTQMGLFNKIKQSRIRLGVKKLNATFDFDSIIYSYNRIGGKHCLTTGNFVLLLLCALGYQKIFIHGINLDYRGKNQRYFSNMVLNSPHNMNLERDFLNFLVNRCNIKRLTDIFPENKIEE